MSWVVCPMRERQRTGRDAAEGDARGRGAAERERHGTVWVTSLSVLLPVLVT